MIDTKNSITAYLILYKLIDLWVFASEQEGGSFITPMALAHPLHLIKTGRGKSAETCGLDDVFPPEDRCSDPVTHMLMDVCM